MVVVTPTTIMAVVMLLQMQFVTVELVLAQGSDSVGRDEKMKKQF